MLFLLKYVNKVTGVQWFSPEYFSTQESAQLYCDVNTNDYQEITLVNVGDYE